MPFVTLKFAPGVDKDTTDYAAEAPTWSDSDKVRFRMGFPEKIGGWTKYAAAQIMGTARALLPLTVLSGTNHICIGTNKKLYLEQGGSLNDVTPIRATTDPAGADPIDTTDTSPALTFNDTSHGAIVGAYVTISGATATGGVPADEINAEHVITAVPTANSFTFEVSTAATSTASGGGVSVVAAYQLNPGLDTSVAGTGWGVDGYGAGGWGEAASGATDITEQLRLWSLDAFGEDLVANIRNGGIYYWDASSSVGTRAVNITSLPGSNGAPTIARKILVSSESRHLIAVACDPAEDIGVQDTLLIRWPDAENVLDWIPDTDNSAGSLRLSTGSQLITGILTKREALLWTDTALNVVSYTGPPFFFGTKLVSTNTSIMSPNAAIEVNEVVFWMGLENFYIYDGAVRSVPCNQRSFVFGELNFSQRLKVYAALNKGDNEVTWHYPSSGSKEVDRYITFNYMENVWYGGTMARTAWMDRSFNRYPIAAGADGYLYDHEKGCDDGSTSPATALDAYIESDAFEAVPGEGYIFGLARRIIPDVTFTGSETANPSVNITLSPRDFPGGAVGTETANEIARSSTTPVEQYTKDAHIRVRGRSFVYRIESDDLGVAWREGSPRVEVRMDGRR